MSGSIVHRVDTEIFHTNTCTWLCVAVACVRDFQQTQGSAVHLVNTEIFHRLHENVHVVVCGYGMCQSSSPDTRLGLPPCQHGERPQTALTPARVWLWHVSELFNRHQARPCNASKRRSFTDCISMCTWLCVAVACVRALHLTPLGRALSCTLLIHKLSIDNTASCTLS